jgi:hypothetical protein
MDRSYHAAKKAILGPAGLLAGHDMPGITIVMAEAGAPDPNQADKPSAQLRAMADCMERYTSEKVTELRKLADALDRAPDPD